jgi:hypothetical protein
MPIPGASAWRRRCLATPLYRHRMWAASRNQLLNGANGHIFDANAIPYGAFFTPDPKTGALNNHISPYTGTGCNPLTEQ